MATFKIFSGTANPAVAKDIVEHLGYELSEVTIKRFSDGEINVQINESVRGKDVFIVQSTCAPANANLMELLIMTDALRRASAKSITAIVPYFGYARQDRKAAPRVPITAKLVANLMQTAGIDRVVTMDLHAGQIQGFFDIPVDNLYGSVLFIDYIQRKNLSLLHGTTRNRRRCGHGHWHLRCRAESGWCHVPACRLHRRLPCYRRHHHQNPRPRSRIPRTASAHRMPAAAQRCQREYFAHD